MGEVPAQKTRTIANPRRETQQSTAKALYLIVVIGNPIIINLSLKELDLGVDIDRAY